MTDSPLVFAWDGDVMMPVASCRRAANERYVVGERYRMAVVEERSLASHNHFFASVAEAWSNLPEHFAGRFATPEHLRKFALIRCGYANQRQIVCASKAEAQRLRAFIEPMDDYAIVEASEAVVTVWTAQSQSRKAMGNKPFQESKTKVLDFLAGMIGVATKDLETAEAA